MKCLIVFFLILPQTALGDANCNWTPDRFSLKNLNDLDKLQGYVLYAAIQPYYRQVINGTSVETKDLERLCRKITDAKRLHKDPNLVRLPLN